MYHIPVLLKVSVDGLNIKQDGTYVDATFGGGGHAAEIMSRLQNGRLIAFDQDADAIGNKIEDDRFTLISQNFRHLKNFLRLHEIAGVDGILADLGVSSHQFDVADRGFSTRFDGLLDMRMSRNQVVSASDIVNTYSLEELITIFREYGELRNGRRLAQLIIAKREEEPIKSTAQLAETVGGCFPKNKRNKSLALVFQALRIAVNDELGALKDLLQQAADVLKQGGRLVVISYHSLEDRLVKNFIRTGNFEGKLEKDFYGNPIVLFKAIQTKPIVPEEKEIELNSRARSAKLRIAEKI